MVICEIALKISPELLRKLWAYAAYAQGTRRSEVSGFGEVDVDGHTLNVSNQFHMIKQQGSIAGTHLDMGALADLVHLYTETGQNPKKLRFWFHTHPDDVFFSWTDDATISKLTKWGLDPLVAGVANKHGDTRWVVVRGQQRVLEISFQVPGNSLSTKELEEAKNVINPILVVKPATKWPTIWSQRDQDTFSWKHK